MAIVAVFEFPNDTIDQYEKVFAFGGAPIIDQPKRLDHLCYRTGDTGFVVVDIWEDEDAFAEFGGIIGPAAQKAGLEAKPVVYPLQGRVLPGGGRNP